MQPKVSMVVPCYNKIQWVSEMFDSVLAQKWDNIELILVNDGSTDGTREIITDYEPKFHGRGYEVVIIDQENQGAPAAIKHGLMRATSEYVCIPDCDDVLHPEYVSAMTTLLVENENFDCVACDYKRTPYDYESSACLKQGVIDEGGTQVYPYKLMESVLLDRISTSAGRYMHRMRILKAAAVITSFVTDPRVSQEYQILIPLALRDIRIVGYHRALYHYRLPNLINPDRKRHATIDAFIDHCNAFKEIIKKTFQEQSLCFNDYYLQLRIIANYFLFQSHPSQDSSVHEDFYRNEMLTCINKTGLLKRSIEKNVVEEAGAGVLFRYFSNHVIGYPQVRVKICRKSEEGRVIAYAAYGRAASVVKHGLLNSDIRPDVFWDIAAKPDDRIDGIPVLAPEFETLTSNDTVLVLLRDMMIAQHVKDILDQTDARGNSWYYYDVWDYLTTYFFD